MAKSSIVEVLLYSECASGLCLHKEGVALAFEFTQTKENMEFL